MALKLIDSYNAAAYPYSHITLFEDRFDSSELAERKYAFNRAVQKASIDDYKIFSNDNEMEMRFKTATDMFRFGVALNLKNPVEVDYFHAEPHMSNRALDRARKSLHKIIKGEKLEDRIRLELDRGNKSVAVYATDGHAFLSFDHACRAAKNKKLSTLLAP